METIFPLIAAVILLAALDRGEAGARLNRRREMAGIAASANRVRHAR